MTLEKPAGNRLADVKSGRLAQAAGQLLREAAGPGLQDRLGLDERPASSAQRPAPAPSVPQLPPSLNPTFGCVVKERGRRERKRFFFLLNDDWGFPFLVVVVY